MKHAITNAFTVDVEDYFQVTGFEKTIPRAAWDSYESRVVSSTCRLLELLAVKNVHGTFFVLGWVADKFPALVRKIHAAGHELGSHSYWHRLVYALSPDEFREDLRRSKKAIEDAAGVAVNVFRAPSFSITEHSRWAWDILCEEGFTIDSSVVPAKHDRYGIPNAPRQPHVIRVGEHHLHEFPLPIAKACGISLPIGGGGYFRLYPFELTRRLLDNVNAAGLPFTFYVHPWEIDSRQPRLTAGNYLNRFRHYVGLARTELKLKQLLDHFAFDTMSSVLARQDFVSSGQLASARQNAEVLA